MWLLGFSTTQRRHFWIIGAILLVLIVIIILKKLAIYFDKQPTICSNKISQEPKDCEKGDTKQETYDEEKEKKKKKIICMSSSNTDGVVRTYSLEELKMATRNFRIRIGIGATSFVYLAEVGGGQYGAVKRVMAERGGSHKIFLDEVSVLLRISHPNLVALLGFCLDKGEQLLLLEYVLNKSLFNKMHTDEGKSSGTLTWSNRMNIALDIARALYYLHSEADPPIIHRDAKSSNILFMDNDHAKLADFGLCKLSQDQEKCATRLDKPTSIKGSLGYIDTTYLKTGQVSTKSDVYSYGILLLELITGLKSMQGSVTLAERTEEWRRESDYDIQVLGIKMLDPKLNIWDVNLEQFKVLIDLANAALLENPQARPDMSQIVNGILGCAHLLPYPHQLPLFNC